jgi:hypothetical protein
VIIEQFRLPETGRAIVGQAPLFFIGISRSRAEAEYMGKT